MTTITDAYFAGLFDGEGCVTMHLAKAGYMSVQVKVSMCDRAPIFALHQRFGGKFDEKQITKTGRTIYSWSLFNADCVEALSMFAKQCLVKNLVAQAALPTAQAMYANPTRGILTQEEKKSRVQAAQIIAKINKPVGFRRILNEECVAEYMRPKKIGGGKKVRLSDGREFDSLSAAGRAIGVTASAVRQARQNNRAVRGLMVESA
jgi:hypothetical protein